MAEDTLLTDLLRLVTALLVRTFFLVSSMQCLRLLTASAPPPPVLNWHALEMLGTSFSMSLALMFLQTTITDLEGRRENAIKELQALPLTVPVLGRQKSVTVSECHSIR